jgi:hypothetical protein
MPILTNSILAKIDRCDKFPALTFKIYLQIGIFTTGPVERQIWLAQNMANAKNQPIFSIFDYYKFGAHSSLSLQGYHQPVEVDW